MLRRLWAMLAGPGLRRDEGAQHTEAAMLIATLALLGGAMVAAAPSIGEATADFWRCQLSNGSAAGGAACGADQDRGGDRSARRQARETGDSQGIARAISDAQSGNGTDSAASHLPGRTTPPPGHGNDLVYNTPGATEAPFSNCKVWRNRTSSRTGNNYQDKLCTDLDGEVWSCSTGVPERGSCSGTSIPEEALDCALEGTSPTTSFCTGKDGGEYHCTHVQGGNRTCRNVDWDADTRLPGEPESCSAENPSGETVCLGKNGTLYRCGNVAGVDSDPRDCSRSHREVASNDPALSDCVDVPQYGASAVQCTYTPAEDQCPAGAAEQTCSASAAPTSVLCHDTSASGSGFGVLDQCQDLGGLVDPKDKREGLCLVGEKPGQACGSSAPVEYFDFTPETSFESGGITFDVGPDVTTTVPDEAGNPVELDQDELATYCARNTDDCHDLIVNQATRLRDEALDDLRKAGVCSSIESCRAVSRGEGEGEGRRGRTPQAVPDVAKNLARIGVATGGAWGAAYGLSQYARNDFDDENDPQARKRDAITAFTPVVVVLGATALLSRPELFNPVQQAAALAVLGARGLGDYISENYAPDFGNLLADTTNYFQTVREEGPRGDDNV